MGDNLTDLVVLEDETRLTEVGLLLGVKVDVSFDYWERLVEFSWDIGTGAKWALADLLAYGQTHWPEEWASVLSALKFKPGTIANMMWVARHVPWSVRQPGVSFSHHQAVAHLEPDAQLLWLNEARDNEWTRDELRNALQGNQLTDNDKDGAVRVMPATPESALRLVLDVLRGKVKMEKDELVELIQQFLKEHKL